MKLWTGAEAMEVLTEERLARAICAARNPKEDPHDPDLFVDNECRDIAMHARTYFLSALTTEPSPLDAVRCINCRHPWSHHSRGGMCDGEGTVCHCSRMRPVTANFDEDGDL